MNIFKKLFSKLNGDTLDTAILTEIRKKAHDMFVIEVDKDREIYNIYKKTAGTKTKCGIYRDKNVAEWYLEHYRKQEADKLSSQQLQERRTSRVNKPYEAK